MALICADAKIMLLHDPKLDENSIGNFFSDVYELYIKVCTQNHNTKVIY